LGSQYSNGQRQYAIWVEFCVLFGTMTSVVALRLFHNLLGSQIPQHQPAYFVDEVFRLLVAKYFRTGRWRSMKRPGEATTRSKPRRVKPTRSSE
jgi:hypothetical protein